MNKKKGIKMTSKLLEKSVLGRNRARGDVGEGVEFP